jgi:hypothetical protein
MSISDAAGCPTNRLAIDRKKRKRRSPALSPAKLRAKPLTMRAELAETQSVPRGGYLPS